MKKLFSIIFTWLILESLGLAASVQDFKQIDTVTRNKLQDYIGTLGGGGGAGTNTVGAVVATTPLVNSVVNGTNNLTLSTVTVPKGGTGLATLSTNQLLYGNATGPVGFLGLGTSVLTLHGNATGIPVYSPVNVATDTITGVGAVSNGFTGVTTFTGNILIPADTNGFVKATVTNGLAGITVTNGLASIAYVDGATNAIGGSSFSTNSPYIFLTNQTISVASAPSGMYGLKINFQAGGSSGNTLLGLQAAGADKVLFDGRGILIKAGGNDTYFDAAALQLNSTGIAEISNQRATQGAAVGISASLGGSATTNAVIIYANGESIGEVARWDKRGMRLGTNGFFVKTFGGGPITTNFGTVAQNQGLSVIEGVACTDAALGDKVVIGLPLQYTNFPLLKVEGIVTSANTIQLRAVNLQTVGNAATTNDVLNFFLIH